MERRFSNKQSLSIETRADGASRIAGYGAVFYDGSRGTQYDIWTDFVERIMPTAFDRAVKEDDVRGLFNHDANQILGRTSAKTMRLSVDPKGLRYEIDLPPGARSADLVEHIRRGDITGSSFGFMVTDQDWRTEDGIDIREIRGVQLFDVGPVTFPAYEATTAETKSRDGVSDAVAAREKWRAEVQAEIEAYRRRAEIVGLCT